MKVLPRVHAAADVSKHTHTHTHTVKDAHAGRQWAVSSPFCQPPVS